MYQVTKHDEMLEENESEAVIKEKWEELAHKTDLNPFLNLPTILNFFKEILMFNWY